MSKVFSSKISPYTRQQKFILWDYEKLKPLQKQKKKQKKHNNTNTTPMSPEELQAVKDLTPEQLAKYAERFARQKIYRETKQNRIT